MGLEVWKIIRSAPCSVSGPCSFLPNDCAAPAELRLMDAVLPFGGNGADEVYRGTTF